MSATFDTKPSTKRSSVKIFGPTWLSEVSGERQSKILAPSRVVPPIHLAVRQRKVTDLRPVQPTPGKRRGRSILLDKAMPTVERAKIPFNF